MPRERLWGLLRALPGGYYKVDLAARLEARGHLANELPDAGQALQVLYEF